MTLTPLDGALEVQTLLLLFRRSKRPQFISAAGSVNSAFGMYHHFRGGKKQHHTNTETQTDIKGICKPTAHIYLSISPMLR